MRHFSHLPKQVLSTPVYQSDSKGTVELTSEGDFAFPTTDLAMRPSPALCQPALLSGRVAAHSARSKVTAQS